MKCETHPPTPIVISSSSSESEGRGFNVGPKRRHQGSQQQVPLPAYVVDGNDGLRSHPPRQTVTASPTSLAEDLKMGIEPYFLLLYLDYHSQGIQLVTIERTHPTLLPL